MTEFKPYAYGDDLIRERVLAILSNELTDQERQSALRIILGSIDLTTLEGTDTDEKVVGLCRQAGSFSKRKPGVPDVAAVCVYPPFVGLAKDQLDGSDIKTACVATAFPSGQTFPEVKQKEVEFVLAAGAEEVDMVISRGKLLEGKHQFVFDEIRMVKELCGEIHLKVILETGELSTVANIRIASEIALKAGADFLKTSTGKVQPAATPEAFLVMLDTIKEYHEATGRKAGIKAAGGVADAATALQYYLLTREILGEEWLQSSLFRIGASRLAENVFTEL